MEIFSFEDSHRSGRSSFVNIENLLAVFEEIAKYPARELTKRFNTSHTWIIKHLYEPENMYKLGQWVPHQLTASHLAESVFLRLSLKSRLPSGELSPVVKSR